jgi:hypothetical protein
VRVRCRAPAAGKSQPRSRYLRSSPRRRGPSSARCLRIPAFAGKSGQMPQIIDIPPRRP